MTGARVRPPPGLRWISAEKPKALLPALGRLYSHFGKYGKIVAFVVFLGTVSSLLSVIGPQFLSDMADSVAHSIKTGTDVDMGFVARTAAALAAIYAASAILLYVSKRVSRTTGERMGMDLRVRLSEKISRISIGDLSRMRSGDVVSRFVNDTDTIRMRAADSIVDTIEALVMFCGAVAMMFYTDWRLALVSIIPTAAGFVLIRMIVRVSRKYYRVQSRNLGKVNNLVEETFRGLDVVKTYNGTESVRRSFDDVNDELYETAFKSRFLGGLMPEINGFINNVSYVLVCILGSVFVLGGTATFGTIVAFIVYVKLMNQPLMGITHSLSALQEVAAASERVFEFLDAEEMDCEAGKTRGLEDVVGDVSFDGVSFSYVPGREVISRLDLRVDAGQKVAIVGPTGAGKTTITNLLLRFYEPNEGSISVDGVDIASMDRGSVRDMFGVVMQDTWLFNGTIRQNIAFGDDGPDDSKIMEAVEAVGLKHFVLSQKDGLDSHIPDPSRLSNGQRQQISIARALVKDAPMLILDEATSSVDTRTERHIQEAMDRLMAGRTSFIVAHRLSTIVKADAILVIRKGRIVESGTHGELLAMGGFYKSLYDSQFESCE